MKRQLMRVLSMVLSFVLVFASVPFSAYADEIEKSEQPVIEQVVEEETVEEVVKEAEETVEEAEDKVIEIVDDITEEPEISEEVIDASKEAELTEENDEEEPLEEIVEASPANLIYREITGEPCAEVIVKGMLPAGVKVHAVKLTYEDVKEYVENEEDFKSAYDVTLLLDGEEYQPEEPVSVEFKEVNDIENLEVTHVHEEGTEDEEITTVEVSEGEDGNAEIEVDGFSWMILTTQPIAATVTVGGYSILLPDGVSLPAGAGSDTTVTHVTSADTEWGTASQTTWYVATADESIVIDNTVEILGNLNLILEDGCDLTVNGSTSTEGILINDENCSLTIYAQSEGDDMGKLTACGSNYSYDYYKAGIGNKRSSKCGDITINGGKIIAKGSGSQENSVIHGRNVLLNGGDVSTEKIGSSSFGITATNNLSINGGKVNSHDSISAENVDISSGELEAVFLMVIKNCNITGGKVTIGGILVGEDGGECNEPATINISGGIVTSSDEGISASGSSATINISGENTIVYTTGSEYGISAYAGGSDENNDATINILGGTVSATATEIDGTGILVKSNSGTANLEITGGEVTATAQGDVGSKFGSIGISVYSNSGSATAKINGKDTIVNSVGKNTGIGVITCSSAGNCIARLDILNGTVHSEGESTGIGVSDYYNDGEAGTNTVIINIEGGEVEAEGNGTEGGGINVHAPCGEAEILISNKDTKVTAIGCDHGVFAYTGKGTSTIDIKEATLITEGKNGIIAYNDGDIGTCTINISGDSAVVNSKGEYNGICASSNVNIYGGMVNAFGEIAGILSIQDITITGGNTTTNGHTQSLNGLNSVNVHKANENDKDIFVTDLVEGTNIYTATSTSGINIKSSFTDTKLVRIAPAVCFIDENENVKLDGNEKEYGSIISAIKSNGDEKTIVLITDDTEDVIIPAGYDITLDLNGHVLLDNGENYKGVIEIEKGSGGNNAGILTVVDSNSDKLSHNFEVNDAGLWVLTDKEYTKTYEKLEKFPAQEGDIIKVIGGVITSDNDTGYRMGIYTKTDAYLTLESGNIIGNANTGIYNEGYFIMNSGLIAGNIGVDYAGGVYNENSFVMNGGKITNNFSYGTGGGVINGGSFAMIDGLILANEALFGGGVLSGGTTTIGGSSKIFGNSATSMVDNIAILNKLTIGNSTNGIDGNKVLKPTSSMKVGVTLLGIAGSVPYVTVGAFTTNGTSNDKQYFFSDYNTYYVKHISADPAHLELATATIIIDKDIEHGTVSVNDQGAASGTTVTVTATPDSGYELDSITVTDATGTDITSSVVSGLSITVPATDKLPITVSATFAQAQQRYSESSEETRDRSYYIKGTWNSPARGTWTLKADGKWRFGNYGTSEFRNTWAYLYNPYAKGGQNTTDWFYFDNDGNMVTGWQVINGKTYYFNEVSDGTLGAMATGWKLLEGKWYYFSETKDFEGGMLKAGWMTDPQDGHVYYLDPKTGIMAIGRTVIDGKVYYFNVIVPNASGWTRDASGHWVYEKRQIIPLGALIQ